MLVISDLIDKQVSMAFLNNVLYSITWVYQICVYDDPCKASTVRMILVSLSLLSISWRFAHTIFL